MARIISSTAQEAINASATSEVFLALIEIDHATLGTPLRFVNNTADITSNGNVYTACAFSFTPPIDEEGTIQNATITLDNVDRSIVQILRGLETPPTVAAEIILADTPDIVEAGPWEFVLRNVSYTAQQISGDLVYQTYAHDLLSIYKYTNVDFPGLYD